MAKIQRVRNDQGEVTGYRSQPRHPLTGRKVSITGATEGEVRRRLTELQVLRRDRLAGASPEEIQEAYARRVMRPKKLSERWRQWLVVHRDSTGFAPRKSSWLYRVEPHFGDCVPAELTPSRMAEWQVSLKKKYAQKTIVEAYWLLVALIKPAIHDGELTALPWGDWRPDRPLPAERAEAASWEEWLLLVSAALSFSRERWERGTYCDAFQALVVMGLTGIRQAEAAGLGWDCLELDRRDTPAILTVRWQARKGWWRRSDDRPRDVPKGKRRRAQVMHASAAEVLRRHREELRRRGWYRDDGPVFPCHEGQWRRSAYVIRSETLRELVRRAGLSSVEQWTGHSLRHTFCTLEANANVDLKAVMQRAGHTDVRTTLGYVHAARRLPPSPLPPLELGDYLPAAPTLVESSDGELLPAPPDLTRAAAEKVVSRQERKKGLRARESELAKASFAVVARRWIDVGAADKQLPPEVAAAKRRAYVRAYVAAQRKEPDAPKAQWQRAGKRAQYATLGAWRKALARARADAEKDDLPY